jgi:competence protein ComGC
MSEPENNSGSGFGFTEIVILIFLIGVVVAIAIPNFVRDPWTSPANACINNLREIDASKNQWALEHNAKSNDVVTINDIKPYIESERNNAFIKLDAKGNLPKCPSGGTYTIGKVGEPPTCSLGTNVIPAHVLP